jgi:hypothetical protein
VILGCPGSVREERYHQRKCRAGHQWLTSVILATQETEIRSITVRSQSGQIVGETLFQKSPSKKGTGGVAQGVGPEFKPQHPKKRQKSASHTCKYIWYSLEQSAIAKDWEQF